MLKRSICTLQTAGYFFTTRWSGASSPEKQFAWVAIPSLSFSNRVSLTPARLPSPQPRLAAMGQQERHPVRSLQIPRTWSRGSSDPPVHRPDLTGPLSLSRSTPTSRASSRMQRRRQATRLSPSLATSTVCASSTCPTSSRTSNGCPVVCLSVADCSTDSFRV